MDKQCREAPSESPYEAMYQALSASRRRWLWHPLAVASALLGGWALLQVAQGEAPLPKLVGLVLIFAVLFARGAYILEALLSGLNQSNEEHELVVSGLAFLRSMQYKDKTAAMESIDQEAEAAIAGAQTRTQLPLFIFPLVGAYLLTNGSQISAEVGAGIAFVLVFIANSFLRTVDRSHIDTAMRRAIARYHNEQQQSSGDTVQVHAEPKMDAKAHLLPTLIQISLLAGLSLLRRRS